jgi:hypothetical protein
MKSRCLLLLAVLAAAALAAPPQDSRGPAPRVVRLQWRDLDRLTRGRSISLVLPSGIELGGIVASVEKEELILDVRKTSNKQAYPKGRATVPRPEVKRCRVVTKNSHTWAGVGGGIGAAIGTLVAIPVAQCCSSPAKSAALAIAIPAAVGYLLGREADRAVMDIIIEPDPPAPDEPGGF